MGLFSSSKKIYVASSAYNLAGDEMDRPIFLKNLIVRNILSDTNESLGETINNGYLQGPGIQLRTFYRWALNNYTIVGMPNAYLFEGLIHNTDILIPHIPHDPSYSVWIQRAEIVYADYYYFAEQYMINNHPELYESEWEADIDEETGIIYITLEDNSIIELVPDDFDPDAEYIYTYYTLSIPDQEGPVVEGELSPLAPDEELPDLTDMVPESEEIEVRTETLTKTTRVYTLIIEPPEPPEEPEEPPEEEEPEEEEEGPWEPVIPEEPPVGLEPVEVTEEFTTEDVEKITREYFYEDNLRQGIEEDAVLYDRNYLTIIYDKRIEVIPTLTIEQEELPDGSIKVTYTEVLDEQLVDDIWLKHDVQEIKEITFEDLKLWLYRIGSGVEELDELSKRIKDYGYFFPIIPIRHGENWAHNWGGGWAELFEQVKPAIRKGTGGGNYHTLRKKIQSSADVGDIDHIYIVYGVALNVIDNSARLYIYKFFKRIMEDYNASIPGQEYLKDLELYKQKVAEYNEAYLNWLEWRKGLSNPGSGRFTGIGKIAPAPPKPTMPRKPSLPKGSIRISNTGHTIEPDPDDEDGEPIQTRNISYRITISWNFIIEHDEQEGLGKPDAKKGDVWLVNGETTTIPDPIYTGEDPFNDAYGNSLSWLRLRSQGDRSFHTIYVYHQYEENKYRYLEIAGLHHDNRIYKKKSVGISAKSALEDADESGFIIPLHYATFRDMRLVDATQMGTACIFLVMNAYEVVKKKWYQKGFFKIVFVVAVAIISVAFTGGAGIGLLGAHAAVGGALGLSGVAAAVVGAVANALAALVLTTIITKLTSSIGPIGAIIGAVATIAITAAVTNFHMSGNFGLDFSKLMRAENILKLTDAVSNGYQEYVQAAIEDIQEDLTKYQEEANRELRRIREQYVEQHGYGSVPIDPMMYVSDSSNFIAESRDSFLARTLMTGSDVAQMSFDLLNDFAELNLALPDAFV